MAASYRTISACRCYQRQRIKAADETARTGKHVTIVSWSLPLTLKFVVVVALPLSLPRKQWLAASANEISSFLILRAENLPWQFGDILNETAAFRGKFAAHLLDGWQADWHGALLCSWCCCTGPASWYFACKKRRRKKQGAKMKNQDKVLA